MQQLFKEILEAKIYQLADTTPLEFASVLSKRYQNKIFIKREDLQVVHSFKIRGAYNKIRKLSDAKKRAGIIASSAGNHAQGVALSAKKINIKATIVMPVTTPDIKVEAVKLYGAKVVLFGDNYDEAKNKSIELAQQNNLTIISPFDDMDVIAGQGVIGAEILEQHPEPIDAVFVPVGGGGLIAGMAAYIKTMRPEIKIIGVEPVDAPSLYEAMQAGKRVMLDQVGIFADGVAVKQVGEHTFKIAKHMVDEVVLVSVDEICAAMKDIFEDNRSMAEPAGAVSVAGLKKYVQQHQLIDSSLIAIESGANINFDRLRHVAERADIGERKETVFAATINEKPGSFKTFCQLLGKRKITEFNYRYADTTLAHVFVGTENMDDNLFDKLRANHIPIEDLSEDDVANQHVRYMVGGRAPNIENEVLYRFEFPERPGALLDFLNKIGSKWNISLFHYRNHGAAFGRVLVGVQVPTDDISTIETFFDSLNFRYIKEEDNPAYKMFLS